MARAACPDRRLLESSLRGKARSMLFSNSVVDEFCEGATLPEMRAVEGLLARQMEVRAANQLERRMRRARFPAAKSLDGYDFSQVSFPDGYGEADLRSLAFIDACQDFVFHGKTGRGKTHLAIAVGAAAVRAGKSVRFFTVAQLVMHLADARDAAGCAGSSTTCCRRTCWYSTSSATCRSTSRGRGCCSRSCRPPRHPEPHSHHQHRVQQVGHGVRRRQDGRGVVDRLVYTGRLVEFNGASYRMENALMLGKGEAE